MAVHKYFDHSGRITEYSCENCHRHVESDERRYFTPSTRQPTVLLCPWCYRSAQFGQFLMVGLSAVVFVVLIGWAVLFG